MMNKSDFLKIKENFIRLKKGELIKECLKIAKNIKNFFIKKG